MDHSHPSHSVYRPVEPLKAGDPILYEAQLEPGRDGWLVYREAPRRWKRGTVVVLRPERGTIVVSMGKTQRELDISSEGWAWHRITILDLLAEI